MTIEEQMKITNDLFISTILLSHIEDYSFLPKDIENGKKLLEYLEKQIENGKNKGV